MIMHTLIIILNELKPSPLVKIQLFLGEHILKALIIGEHIYMNNIQLVSPYLEFKHHCCKLEIMSWIVLLKHLKLSRGMRYNHISLYQHTTKANSGCIAIDHITILTLRRIKTGVVVNLVFNSAKLFSQSSNYWNLTILWVNLVNGEGMDENISTNFL